MGRTLGSCCLFILFLLILSGCAIKLSYTLAPDEDRQAVIPANIGVALFDDHTDRNFINYPATKIANPIETFSDAMHKALAGQRLFKSVKYLGFNVAPTTDFKKLGEQYGIDAILVGRVSRIYLSSGPAPKFFMLLPFSLFSALGLPTANCKYSIDCVIESRLISCKNGREIWKSAERSIHFKKTAWVSALTDHEVMEQIASEGMSQLARRIARYMSGRVEDNITYYIASIVEPGILETISDISPVHTDTDTDEFFQPLEIKPTKDAELSPVKKALTYGNSYALIIGIDKYSYMPDLKTSVNDAKKIGTLLMKNYGFKVQTLINPNKKDILAALKKYRQVLTPADQFLIYYSGYSWWLGTYEDQGYWLAADATWEKQENWISNTSITYEVLDFNSKHVMVIADGSYSDKFSKDVQPKELTREYLYKMATSNAWIALTSGGLEPIINVEETGETSVFASALIDALNENPGIIDGTTLYNQIRSKMRLVTKQTPEYGNISRMDDAEGDFLFICTHCKKKDKKPDKPTQLKDPTILAPEDSIKTDLKSLPDTADDITNGKYHALIIGIDNYEYIPALQTSSNDARELALLLEQNYEFTIQTLINPNQKDILSALEKYRDILTPADSLLIYYSGYSWWMGGIEDEGYWLAANATWENQDNWVANSDITTAINACKARHIIVIADGSYSKQWPKDLEVKKLGKEDIDELSEQQARVVLTSGSLEPIIDPESNGKYSVFASALIDALRENMNVINGTALYNKIQSKMSLVTGQPLGYANINKVGDEDGDFLFINLNNQINTKNHEHPVPPKRQIPKGPLLEEADEQEQLLEDDYEQGQLLEEADEQDQLIEDDYKQDPLLEETDEQDKLLEKTYEQDPLLDEDDERNQLLENGYEKAPLFEEADEQDKLPEETYKQDPLLDENDEQNQLIEDNDEQDPLLEEDDE